MDCETSLNAFTLLFIYSCKHTKAFAFSGEGDDHFFLFLYIQRNTRLINAAL